MKALVVYGTTFGATAGTALEIAKTLRMEGFEVKVSNLKEEKIQDLAEYELTVVGSGMNMGNWTKEAEEFLKRFQNSLRDKKLALFISSLKPIEEKLEKPERIERTRKVGLDDKILKYHLKPIIVGFFGGVLNFNKMSFLVRKSVELGYKSQLQKHGFREVEPGVYDLRDWDEIRNWAVELSKKAKE